MQILVVDESEKKAWRRSRRVLAAALYRRGSRTFSGRLSQEGLLELLSELRKAASRHTSIIVYKLTAHSEFEVAARIGNTHAWGEEGWFAHRVSSRTAAPAEGFSAVERLMRALVRLSALFHDLGKANSQFQQMLRGKAGPQRYRHELLSFWLLEEAFCNPLSAFEEMEAQGGSVFSPISLTKYQTLDEEAYIREAAPRLLQEMEEATPAGLLACIKYLVLTHHRPLDLPDKLDTEKLELLKGAPSLRRQTNLSREHAEGVPFAAENLAMWPEDTVWHDKRWSAAVTANAKTVSGLLRNNPALLDTLAKHKEAWLKNIALLARPTLIQADHLASAIKVASGSPGQGTYANTIEINGRQVLADTLATHLLKTRYAADSFFKGMSGLAELPAWQPEKKSPLFAKSGHPRFQWQDDIVSTLRAIEGIEHRPFMAMVVSSTGAGKTLAAPKILAAAGGNHLRYTCALGLRSLTLQTGAAYAKQLELGDRGITVVGDALYAKLSQPSDNTYERQGSESLEWDTEIVLTKEPPAVAVSRALQLTPEQTQGLEPGKVLSMLEAPVLTCTVDHLMGASCLSAGTDTRMSLRLATADLVLDEIDNYSLEDLQALGRLVHAAGCYGRRVVLMSATVSDTVLTSLYKAWLAGLEAWAFRHQKPLKPILALVSNQVPSQVIETHQDSAEDALLAFVANLTAFSSQQTPLVKATEVPLGATLEETYHGLYEQCLAFARQHHTLSTHDPANRISTGFVRFNSVKHCRQFARYLVDHAPQPEDIGIRVQCYHRRMPLLHLSRIERELNALLDRKDEQAIFQHPLIASWQAPGKLKLILVATTSIQETGRDHDYDFAIAEPWSSRSLVQLAGRVQRHRRQPAREPNIGMLSKELNYLEGRGSRSLEIGKERWYLPKMKAWQQYSLLSDVQNKQFGPAWPKFGLKHGACVPCPPDTGTRATWFPGYFFSKGIDARVCLAKSESRYSALAMLEHDAQHIRMAGNAATQGRFGLPDILVSYELLWNRHNQLVKFRRQGSGQAQYTLNPYEDFQKLGLVSRHPSTGIVEVHPLKTPGLWKGGTCLQHPERCLVRTDLLTKDDILKALDVRSPNALAAKLGCSFEAYVSATEAYTPSLDFDPLLGADTNPSSIPKKI